MSSNATRGGYYALTEKSDRSARFVISRGQLERLRSNSISWFYIARILGVSRSTIHRRRQELNIEDNYNVITILGQTPPDNTTQTTPTEDITAPTPGQIPP